MSVSDCIPLEQIPSSSRLFREFAEAGSALPPALRDYYSSAPQSDAWMTRPLPSDRADINSVAELLQQQNERWGASAATIDNIDRLRRGARAVVTGQQVSLFGGPLYSLLKAASAVQLARAATKRGYPHVPVFWLATEDHDFAEVNTASFVRERGIETLHLCEVPTTPVPVGPWVPGACLQPSLDEAIAILGGGWASDQLRECYTPDASLGEAFARLFAHLFAEHGLIVMDAREPGFHALAAPVMAYAIEHATALHDALASRDMQLAAAGYHAQVLVNESSGLLFLMNETTGARHALRRSDGGEFVSAGERYSVQALLGILRERPDALSPNALLRPVLQDFLLPTAAYVGGPAEIAYFAQSQVLYQAILSVTTPILPRLSATLVKPKIRRLLARYELQLTQAWAPTEELALRLGARSMTIEAKQKLKDAGTFLHTELQSLEEYAASLDAGLGHTAAVASNKIRYQMNRLRRMMARFELQRGDRILEHAQILSAYLHPKGGLQERKLSGMQFIAEQGPGLIGRLVEEAADRCPGHKIIEL